MDVVFAICDVITVLSYGKVLATGTKNEIQSNSRVIEAYLGHRHA
jgi:branched-chain amino acid transport system ATP-binding protein